MQTTKLFLRCGATVASLALLAACGSPRPAAMPVSAVNVLRPVAVSAPDAVVADVGRGQKTPARLSFRINLDTLGAFRTQQSTPGQAAKTKADLTHIKFYLIASDTGTPPTALSGGTAFTYAITATNRNNNRVDITFSNVAANSSGQSYYVAVAGFSSATYTVANNITNLAAPLNDGTEGLYYVSNSGGDTANPGCVNVAQTSYALSGTDALGVPLKLLNAVSPILDSDVNISSGDEITGDPQGAGS
jgi:hypothetical protein